MSNSSASAGVLHGRRERSILKLTWESDPSIYTRNFIPLFPVISLPPSIRYSGEYAIRWSGTEAETMLSVARRRMVREYGQSFVANGMRKLSPRGEDSSVLASPSSVSHSSTIPESFHSAAFVGAAEMKNCCHGLERPMKNVRSQTRLVGTADQSAENPSKSCHETSDPGTASYAEQAAFVGLRPASILPDRSNPVSSRNAVEAATFVSPNQYTS